MDNKEIKAALKTAREAISNKAYEDALLHCQTVLNSDDKNYTALVFTGVAAEKLDKNDQALKAYKTATEVNPDQLLAWQGLCSFYEKNQIYVAVYKERLAIVYEKLLDFYNSDLGKKEETMKRLASTLSDIGATDKSIEVYQKLLHMTEDKGCTLDIKMTLIKLLENQERINTDLLFDCYDTCLEGGLLSIDGTENILKNYSSILLSIKSREEFERKIEQLSASFSSSVVVQEFQILLEIEKYIGRIDAAESSLFTNKMVLFEKVADEDNGILKIVRGCCYIQDKQYDLAKVSLLQGVEVCPKTIIGYYLLALCFVKLNENQNCVNLAADYFQVLETGKKKLICTIDKKLISYQLFLLQSQALCKIATPSSLQKATEILLKNDDDESSKLLCRVYMKQGQYEKAQELLSNMNCSENEKEFYIGWYDYSMEKYESALSRFEKLCTLSDNEDSDAWCMMGKTLWELLAADSENKNREQKCYTTLLRAAKLDPKNGEPFLYLGRFYTKIRKDNRMARKCYEKSFYLDPSLEESGAAVCDMMCADGDVEGAFNLLVKVTKEASAGSAKWAWLRLGLCQIKENNAISAISSFQSALRADTSDNHVWECLAEAYFHRGSYTAALKAFTKASELDSESLYCLYQIATIRKTLGLYVDAIKEYILILEKSPNYVPALMGLGETNLLLARNHAKENLDGRVKDNCEEALIYLTKAAGERPEMSCLWKLLGDACILVQPLSIENFKMSVPMKLMKKSDQKCSDVIDVGKLDILQLGSRCYGKALKILPENSMLWHDLGISTFYQAKLVSQPEAKSLTEKSFKFLIKAASLDSTNNLHWNALGVLAASKYMNKPEISQHCFIKSVHCESNNVVAWTNLGSLYLQHDNIQLAHETYKVAQSLDPNYVACWIGQAMIAEIVGHEDTMDLYRHTTELNYHPEGSIGYAQWVCNLLQNSRKHQTNLFKYGINKMAAIPSAIESMVWYLEREKDDVTALNMYGLLLEQQKLYTSASTVLKRCVELLQNASDQDVNKLNKARFNLARILSKQNEFVKSVDVFKQTTSEQQLEDKCWYGYSLYKSGNLEESFKVYEKAIDSAESDEDKSHIYAALGMVTYKFGDTAGAKTAFFKSSQIIPPSSYGLKALCVLGLLQADVTLVSAVLQELMKLEACSPCDATWLTVALECIQGNNIQAIRHLQRSVHSNPCLPHAWMLLAQLLLQYFPQRALASISCFKKANGINLSTASIKTSENYDILSIAQLQCGQHDLKSIDKNALRSSQQILHSNPGNISNWLTFICGLHAEGSVRKCLKNDESLRHIELEYLDYLLQNNGMVQANMKFKIWCSKQKVICLIDLGKIEDAKLSIKQIIEELKESEFLSTMQNLLNGSQSEKPAVGSEEDSFYLYKVVVESYINDGLLLESVDLLKQYSLSLIQDSDIWKKLTVLIKIAHILYKVLLSKSEEYVNIKNIFDETICEILRLDASNSIGLFMKGAILLVRKNSDNRHSQMLAKKYFLQSYILSHVNSSLLNGREKSRKQLITLLQLDKKDDKLLEKLLKESEEEDI